MDGGLESGLQPVASEGAPSPAAIGSVAAFVRDRKGDEGRKDDGKMGCSVRLSVFEPEARRDEGVAPCRGAPQAMFGRRD